MMQANVQNHIITPFLLGIIQGLTEFIPVSSTGHLILAQQLFSFQSPPGKIFEVVIQLGSAFAVLVTYFKRLYSDAKMLLPEKLVGVEHRSGRDGKFFLALIVATIPAALLGFLFHHAVKDFLYNPITVAISLLLGGLFFLWIERKKPPISCTYPEDISLRQAISIGLAQALALVPGVSRSGATIASARFFGLSPKAATEFSFFLSIPILMGAGFFDLFSQLNLLSASDIISIVIGFTSAFFSSMLVLRPLITSIERYGFTPFAYYRIALGLFILFHY